MKIIEFLPPEDIVADLGGQTAEEVLAELCRPLARHGFDCEQLLEILLRREGLGSTGIGEGIAIPHGMLPSSRGLFASFGRSKAGIDFNAIDGKPTRFFFTLFVGEGSAGPHLKALARISRIFRDSAFREKILDAKGSAEIFRLIAEADAHDSA
ncbi:MAG TPA: PTS sugar transporter subunit IIA [Anaeromyxobacteraceae bacterium]|nr:PTS sugar transporter subunit IIA [Anaeromyxobacteraceae bacterium]